jgi:hypothetical protein
MIREQNDYLVQPVRLRGLKNKPKIRYFIPNFSLLFQRARAARGYFALCGARPAFRRRLSKNFRESFIKAFKKEFSLTL